MRRMSLSMPERRLPFVQQSRHRSALSAFSGISPHFRPRRHRLSAEHYRREMTDRFTTWKEVTGTATAA